MSRKSHNYDKIVPKLCNKPPFFRGKRILVFSLRFFLDQFAQSHTCTHIRTPTITPKCIWKGVKHTRIFTIHGPARSLSPSNSGGRHVSTEITLLSFPGLVRRYGIASDVTSLRTVTQEAHGGRQRGFRHASSFPFGTALTLGPRTLRRGVQKKKIRYFLAWSMYKHWHSLAIFFKANYLCIEPWGCRWMSWQNTFWADRPAIMSQRTDWRDNSW